MELNIVKVWIDEEAVYIQTDTGKVYKELFANYPRLRYATHKQRANYERGVFGLHWKELDEDLSFEGFTQEKKETPLQKVFKENSDINVSSIARRMRIPQSVMASYVCGIKKPSPARKKQIEETLHSIGKSLLDVKL